MPGSQPPPAINGRRWFDTRPAPFNFSCANCYGSRSMQLRASDIETSIRRHRRVRIGLGVLASSRGAVAAAAASSTPLAATTNALKIDDRAPTSARADDEIQIMHVAAHFRQGMARWLRAPGTVDAAQIDAVDAIATTRFKQHSSYGGTAAAWCDRCFRSAAADQARPAIPGVRRFCPVFPVQAVYGRPIRVSRFIKRTQNPPGQRFRVHVG